MPIMLSPGVQTTEKDFSTYVAQVSSTIVAVVGGATKGEVDTPIFCSSPQDYIRKLGKPTPDSLATYSAIQYLQEGNQLYYVRVGDSDIAPSTLTIQDTTTTPVEVLSIEALTPGTWGDNIKIETSNVSNQIFDMTVYYEGVEVEQYAEASLDSTSENYIEDVVVDSEYIDVIDMQDGTGTDVEVVVESLSGGDNGLSNLQASDIIGELGVTPAEGLQNFKNTEKIDINVLIVPSKSSMSSVAAEMTSICEGRGDCIALIDPPMGLSAQGVADWHNGEGGGVDDPSQALNSSYASLYWSWLKVYDTYYSTERWLPPSGFVAAQFAFNDRQTNPWFAPAGLKRGRVVRALDVEHSPDKGDRNLLYGNGNAVNPIVNFAKDGITIWGQRTLQRKPSATNRVNVRRLLLMIRKAIAGSTRYLTFDPNDEFLWREWKGMVRPYLEGLKNSRAFYDYKVEMGLGTTMTATDIDQNKMNGRVAIKPTKSAEFINIDFVLLSTGAEFK